PPPLLTLLSVDIIVLLVQCRSCGKRDYNAGRSRVEGAKASNWQFGLCVAGHAEARREVQVAVDAGLSFEKARHSLFRLIECCDATAQAAEHARLDSHSSRYRRLSIG
ncbi:MAG: hypothetical protein MHM6MM_008192, partial [Cercozoa sp. M6MM]